MRQAIETRYHGPTNYRGTRVSARANAGRIFLAWDHSTGIEENHARAAARMTSATSGRRTATQRSAPSVLRRLQGLAHCGPLWSRAGRE